MPGASAPHAERRSLTLMEPTNRILLAEARTALHVMAGRTADLLRSLADLDVAIPGSEWTARQAGVHLITGAALAGDIATGMPSPVPGLDPGTLATENAQRIADIPESDPRTLAGLLGDAVRRLLEVTTGRSGRETVLWHGGRRIEVTHLLCISLGELVLHGHDMATAGGLPWTIEPDHARLVLAGYAAVDEGEFLLATLQGRMSWTWL